MGVTQYVGRAYFLLNTTWQESFWVVKFKEVDLEHIELLIFMLESVFFFFAIRVFGFNLCKPIKPRFSGFCIFFRSFGSCLRSGKRQFFCVSPWDLRSTRAEKSMALLIIWVFLKSLGYIMLYNNNMGYIMLYTPTNHCLSSFFRHKHCHSGGILQKKNSHDISTMHLNPIEFVLLMANYHIFRHTQISYHIVALICIYIYRYLLCELYTYIYICIYI